MSEVEDLFVNALDLSLDQKYDEAVAAFNEVLEKDPKYMDGYHSLAMTYMHMGKVDEAIATEQKALEVNPDELMSHSNLSVFFQKKGMIKEAEEAKSKATVLTWRKEEKERKQSKDS